VLHLHLRINPAICDESRVGSDQGRATTIARSRIGVNAELAGAASAGRNTNADAMWVVGFHPDHHDNDRFRSAVRRLTFSQRQLPATLAGYGRAGYLGITEAGRLISRHFVVRHRHGAAPSGGWASAFPVRVSRSADPWKRSRDRARDLKSLSLRHAA
jgi:hypothetical protein